MMNLLLKALKPLEALKDNRGCAFPRAKPCMGGPLLIYVDPISESSRAIVVFCRLFQLPVDVRWVSIKRGEHRTPELTRANPLGKVPFLLDEGVCVPEACAILTYLAQNFQVQVPASWYPTELRAKTQVDAGLHWQQRTLRYHTDKLLSERVVRANRSSSTGAPGSSTEVCDALRGVQEALSQLEHVWLANSQGVQQRQRRDEPAPPMLAQQLLTAAAAIQKPEDPIRSSVDSAQAVIDVVAAGRPGLKPAAAEPPCSNLAASEGKRPTEERVDGAAGHKAAFAPADTLQAIDQATTGGECNASKDAAAAPQAYVQASAAGAGGGKVVANIGERPSTVTVAPACQAVDAQQAAAPASSLADDRKESTAVTAAVAAAGQPGSQLGSPTATSVPRAPTTTSEPGGSPTTFTFMGGGSSPCITDLLCACIVEQLRLLDSVQEKPDWADIILQFPRVRAWLTSVEADCRPHFKEVHMNLRQSVARAHMAVVQQREAVAGTAAPLPGIVAGAGAAASAAAAASTAAAAAGSLAAGRAPSMARVPSFSSSAAAAAAAAAVGQRPAIPHPAVLDAVMILPPSLASPRSSLLLAVPVTAGVSGTAVPTSVASARPPSVPAPQSQVPAPAGGSSGGAGGVAGKPSFTPSFPALPTTAPSSGSAGALRAIFNGQPPAVAAAAATVRPAASGLWGVTGPGIQGALSRSGSSVGVSAIAGNQQRSTAGPAAKGI